MRLPTSGRIGLTLVLLGGFTYAGWTFWANTRTWSPIDFPVSLSPGHIRSNEFIINVDATFILNIRVDRKIDLDRVPCWLGDLPCSSAPSILHVKWALSRAGKIVAHADSDESQTVRAYDETVSREIGAFHVEKGEHYVLDLDVVGDGSRLNRGHPRLDSYYEWGDEYQNYEAYQSSLSVALPLLIFGALLLIRAVSEQVGLHFDAKAFNTIVGGLHVSTPLNRVEGPVERNKLFRLAYSYSGFRPRPPLKQRLPLSLPTIGLTYASIWSSLFLPLFFIFHGWSAQSQGIRVHVLRPGAPVASIGSQPAAVLVQMDATGHCYIASRLVELSELPNALDQAFRTRPDWVVYLDADSRLEFRDVVHVMDIVRGAHGKVILLTPGTKATLRGWKGEKD
jgi:biopolymer transport protein ExbD